MKKIALAAAGMLALGLAGCTTIGADGTVQPAAELKRICDTAPIIHTAFQAVAAQGGISAAVVRSEGEAFVAVSEVCRNPPTDTQTALLVALNAYTKIVEARATAERVAN